MPKKSASSKKKPQKPQTPQKSSPQSFEAPSIPDNFANLIVDFTRDLSVTFPEFSNSWQQWTTLEMPEVEIRHLFDYCLSVYPQRFFDILYQNEDIFKTDSDIDVHFLPGIDFKLLYNCENVSENTRKAIWKYLQVIMLASINSVKDKTDFGDTMNLFDGIDAGDLQLKLAETISSISDFFKSSGLGETRATGENGDEEWETDEEDNGTAGGTAGGETDPLNDFAKTFDFEKMAGSMPNAEGLHEHLKGLFDGKIGSLAKEMAEEISKDFENILGNEGEINDTSDIFKKMMKNPKKIMDLMKTVGAKLNEKMEKGDISKDELMKEAAEWIGKMKEMGGGSDQFSELFKNMAKNMGGMGKNMKIDQNALDRFTKNQSTKERLRNKLEKKKQAAEMARQQAMEQAKKNAENVVLQQTAPNNYVFRVNGEATQEKSTKQSVQNEVDEIMEKMGLEDAVAEPVKKKSKSKSKGKK
uniref:Uncharacterized protein n=1 Tax=viral metagenome TaxID=1070528 RepID=A0A6C0D4S7_9ZZZZ